MKRDDAEEYTAALGQVVGGSYRQIALGVRLGVPRALGVSTRTWVEDRLGGYVRLSIAERRDAVEELAAEGMSQRAIADVLGVSEMSVRRDRATDVAPDVEDLRERDPSATDVAPVDLAPHVTRNTGNDEWYTPPEFIHAARDVLGDIDLDPASSDAANVVVRASKYHTVEDDGLAHDWKGRVWMNPPYSTGLVDRFVVRLLDAYALGDVTAAVVLTNNATDTRWWQSLARRSAAVCMLSGRIRFRSASGEVAGSGLQGQTIAYLGDDRASFAERFAEHGVVL